MEHVPFGRLLRLYLDPFALFKSITVGSAWVRAEAERYNRRNRGLLLIYVRRWAAIAILCAAGMVPLVAMAQEAPIVCIPIVGLELGFATAVCMLVLSIAVYFVLGLES